MEYTQRVAEFVVGTTYEQIPARAVSAAKEVILDSVGVALAGSRDGAGRIAAELAREEQAREAAALFGQGFRSSSATAAFVNGVSTHALDYDASFAITGQPMAGLGAAVFGLAEPLGTSGRQLLEAYVVGFEVTAKLAWSLSPRWSEGGWHSTGVLGSLGCTVAATRLLRLGVDETCMALGIVSSMTSGVVGNHGTMSKPLHAGLAARNGVLAATLAQRGFSGNARMLEAAGGFFEVYGGGPPEDSGPMEELGTRFDLERSLRFKAYPCGGLTHSAIDAVLALCREHSIAAEEIDRIDVTVTPYTTKRIIYRIPATGLQAKFSMPYILARAVLDGKLAPDTFSDEAIREPSALALAERVRMEADPELEDDGSSGRRPARVWIRLKDGRSLYRQVDYPKGTPPAPLSREELKEKFRSCSRPVLGEERLEEAMGIIENLERLENVGALAGLLMGDRGQS